jgi:cytidine deaminase
MDRVEIDWAGLRQAATGAMRHAYAPYSKFPVGAAGLVDDGRVVVGCNVENAAYGVGLCAECGMVSQLHATGGGRLVAVSCVDAVGQPLMPCGRCRQLLWENGGPQCLLYTENGVLTMADVLPFAFDAGDLDRAPVTVLPARLRQYQGHGTVFVHPEMLGGNRMWTGYWERSAGIAQPGTDDDDRPAILEEAPSWPSAREAVAWGRARTPRVVVIDAEGGTYWAGDGEAPREIAAVWSGG